MIKLHKLSLLLLLINVFCLSVMAQNDARPCIEKGNVYYNKNDFKSAAVQYKHACQLDTLSFNAWYNFGNALYQLEKPILASEAYQKAMNLAENKTDKAHILHNLGNIACDAEDYEKAINIYKQSLLLNPTDDETRYNLAFAQAELKKKKEDEEKGENQEKQNKDKPKPSKYAEECLKKSQELLGQYKFEEALKIMQDGLEKDKSVAIFNDYIKKLTDIVKIITDNKE